MTPPSIGLGSDWGSLEAVGWSQYEGECPASGRADRCYTKSFSFLVGLGLSLTDAGAVCVPPGSTTEMG